MGAFCSLQGDQGLGKGEGSPGPPDTGPGGGSSTSGKAWNGGPLPSMVGGAGTEGPCLGRAFYHELSEVVFKFPGASFCQGGQGQGQTEVARKRVWEKQWAELSLGLGLGLPQTLGLRLENQGWEGLEVWEALGLPTAKLNGYGCGCGSQ